MSKDLYTQEKEREFMELFGNEQPEELMSYQIGNLLERLLNNAIISEMRERMIYRSLYNGSLTNSEAYEIIEELQENQRDPILHGFRYNQADIKRKLNKL